MLINRYSTILFLLFFYINSFSQIKKFSSEVLNHPQEHAKEFEKLFNYNEVIKFSKEELPNRVLLENGYVKSAIINPKSWKPANNKIIVTQIDIIFSKYPKNKDFWITNYYDLLAERVKAILAIDSTLNSPDFEWNLVLQTEPNNEAEAKNMFHGIAITYFDIKNMLDSTTEIDESFTQDSIYFARHELKVKNFIRSQGGSEDSIVFNVFERHKEWKNALVVMDWTGSMYRYGAQAVLWHTLNFATSGIKNFVFFNDGDETPDEKKVVGSTGGIYFAQAKNLERLINTFYLVGKRGKGGDDPENDVEAMIKGMNRFEDFDELILIADNNSCMRDFSLLANLDVKVNVIVCGAKLGINPQYVNLAYYTGGSIHTIDEDIEHLSTQVKDNELKINNVEYKLADEGLFTVKYQQQALRFQSCNEITTLVPLSPDPRLAFIVKHGGITDSTVYKVLGRHTLWDNSVVVMDWTKGMYVNSAQAVLWHKTHQKISGINYFVFFNDGNNLPKNKKRIGKTGGIYYQKSNNIHSVEKRFDYIIKRGNGGNDIENNDVEALMSAANKFTKTNNFILIANNQSCVRDIKLMKYLNIPIKIILTNIDGPINPQFINLAYKTGGSIHTLNDDIYNYVFAAIVESNQTLMLGGTEYSLNKDGLFEFKDKSKNKTNCEKNNSKGLLNNILQKF